MTAPDTLPPELAELGELLREDPPRPDPAWARKLDARAAAGFPRPPRRSPWAILKAAPPRARARRELRLRRRCSSSALVDREPRPSDDAGSQRRRRRRRPRAPPRRRRRRAAGAERRVAVADSRRHEPATSMAPAPGGGSPGSDGRAHRAQERSAALTLAARPREIEDVAAGILRVTDAAGGFVASSSRRGGERPAARSSCASPTRRLDKALADLSRLAHVRERTQSTRDITARDGVRARAPARGAARARGPAARARQRHDAQRDGGRQGAAARRSTPEIASARAAVRRVDQPRRLRQRRPSSSSPTAAARRARRPTTAAGRPATRSRDAVRVLEVAAGIARDRARARCCRSRCSPALGALAARMLGRRRRERALDMA